jgi:adhesin/invasin
VAQSNVVVTAIVTPPGVSLSGHNVSTNATGAAIFTNLTLTGTAGTYTLSFGATGLTPTSPVTVTLGAGSGSQLSIDTQPPASAQAGAVFAPQPAIQLLDNASNPVAQAGVQVTASIASGGGTLGGTTTATTNASGVATFTDLVITGTAGPHTLTFSATGYQSATSSTIVVTPGPAAQLSVATQPSATVQSGIAFPQQPVVLVEDQWGNGVSGVDVSVAIASGVGTLDGPSFTATSDGSGLAMFTDLEIDGTIGDFTLSFTHASLSVTSGTVSVAAGPPASIAIITQPGGLASGFPLSPQPVVDVRDSGGNVLQGVTVTAAIAPGSAPGTLGGNLDAITDANGVAAYADLSISGSGTYMLVFTIAQTQITSQPSSAIILP